MAVAVVAVAVMAVAVVMIVVVVVGLGLEQGSHSARWVPDHAELALAVNPLHRAQDLASGLYAGRGAGLDVCNGDVDQPLGGK